MSDSIKEGDRVLVELTVRHVYNDRNRICVELNKDTNGITIDTLRVKEVIPNFVDWDSVNYKDAFVRTYAEDVKIYFLCHDPKDPNKAYFGYPSKDSDSLYNVTSHDKRHILPA